MKILVHDCFQAIIIPSVVERYAFLFVIWVCISYDAESSGLLQGSFCKEVSVIICVRCNIIILEVVVRVFILSVEIAKISSSNSLSTVP